MDGACTGLVDASGTCGECGRFWGEVPLAASAPPAGEANVDTLAPVEDADDLAAHAVGDFGSRTLCPDGACVGVMGPEGRCSECGRAAEPN